MIMLVAFVTFPVGMAAGTTIKAFAAVGLIGFAVAMACIMTLMFSVRCPLCGGNLGFAVAWPATWDLSVSKGIKFCQFCGVSLDEESRL